MAAFVWVKAHLQLAPYAGALIVLLHSLFKGRQSGMLKVGGETAVGWYNCLYLMIRHGRETKKTPLKKERR